MWVIYSFSDSKFEELCKDSTKLTKKYGYDNAKKINQRLNEIKSADSLGLMLQFRIGRCHHLTGNLKGKCAVDLEHPKRLVFEPIFEQAFEPCEIDYYTVEKVLILEVRDYHGK